MRGAEEAPGGRANALADRKRGYRGEREARRETKSALVEGKTLGGENQRERGKTSFQ